MILALRQRHRRTFAVIGSLLPFALVFGVAARHPVPELASLPAELAGSMHTFPVTVWERTDLFPQAPVTVRLRRERAGAGPFAVSFTSAKDFVKPDLIVYWAAGNPRATNTLPDNAQLLGAFNSVSALPLPSAAGAEDGVLLLYSLADHEMVAASSPIRPGVSTR